MNILLFWKEAAVYNSSVEIIKLILAGAFLIAGLVGSIIILIDMFQEEVWKGILGLLCGFYMLYYALFEFDHENKWLIILLSIGGSAIAAGILNL